MSLSSHESESEKSENDYDSETEWLKMAHEETSEECPIPDEVLVKLRGHEIPTELVVAELDEGTSDNEDSWSYNEHKYGPRRHYINGVKMDDETYAAKRALWQNMKMYEKIAQSPAVAEHLAENMKKMTLKDTNPETRKMKGVEDQLVVQTVEWQPHSGLPEKVRKECVIEHERREEIARMWKEEGRVKTYIPGSEEARKLKLKAKLLAKQMAKDELILENAGKPVQILSVEDVQPLLPITEAPI